MLTLDASGTLDKSFYLTFTTLDEQTTCLQHISLNFELDEESNYYLSKAILKRNHSNSENKFQLFFDMDGALLNSKYLNSNDIEEPNIFESEEVCKISRHVKKIADLVIAQFQTVRT